MEDGSKAGVGGRRTARRIAGAGGALVLAAAAALPAPAAAQDEMSASVALVGGAFQYDLSGTGTVPFGGVRLSLPMHAWIVIEPGLTYAAYDAQDGEGVPLLIPEAQLQGRIEMGRVDPFLGLGAGGVFDLREDRSGGELLVSTYSAAAGARAWLGRGWTGRAELRVRGVDGFTGSAAEWTLGIARYF